MRAYLHCSCRVQVYACLAIKVIHVNGIKLKIHVDAQA